MYKSVAAAVRDTMGRKVSTANSKMPGSSFATDPFACNVGGKLAAVEGSVCSKCYAQRIAKMRPSVAKGYAMNEQVLRQVSAAKGRARDLFVSGMAHQIRAAYFKSKPNIITSRAGEKHHRWFDAGDLANLDVLRTIVLVCEKTPEVNHWLPTRELKIVREYLKKHGEFPKNLTVRVSSTMVNDKPRSGGWNTSTVHTKDKDPSGHICPARTQDNQCGDCRACWDSNVKNVSYPVH